MHFRPLTRSRGGWAPAPRAGGAGSAGGGLFPRGGETGYMTPTTLSRIGGPNESCRLRRRIHRPARGTGRWILRRRRQQTWRAPSRERVVGALPRGGVTGYVTP